MANILILSKPENLSRVESGPVQFGDDWPGVFIRGDNALTFAHMLREGLTYIPEREYLLLAQLIGLADTLQSCSVGNTGWPLTPRTIRDNWIERFEAVKRELIDGGMSPEEADEKAARDVITELRES